MNFLTFYDLWKIVLLVAMLPAVRSVCWEKSVGWQWCQLQPRTAPLRTLTWALSLPGKLLNHRQFSFGLTFTGRTGPNLGLQLALYGKITCFTQSLSRMPPEAFRWCGQFTNQVTSHIFSPAWFRGVCDDTWPLKLFAGLCYLECLVPSFYTISRKFQFTLLPLCRPLNRRGVEGGIQLWISRLQLSSGAPDHVWREINAVCAQREALAKLQTNVSC